MSFVGKILTVVQLLLSILFMAFAGAIFTQQNNWKDRAQKTQKELTDFKSVVDREKADKQKALEKRDGEAKEWETKASQFEGEVKMTAKDILAIKAQKEQFEQKFQSQSAIASAAADEAAHRTEETLKQRIANGELHKSFDEAAKTAREHADVIFAKEKELAQLKDKYTEMLKEKGLLEQVVRSHGLNVNDRELAKTQAPAPKRSGLVTAVSNDKTNRPKFLLISLGKDDDLNIGNFVDVIRTAETGDKPEYLCKAKIVKIEPRSATCEVVSPPKNGVIKIGDTASTDL